MFHPQIACSVTNPPSHSQPVIVCCTNSATLHQFCHTSTSTEGNFPKRISTGQHYNFHLFLVQLKKNTGNAIEEKGCSHYSLQFKAKIWPAFFFLSILHFSNETVRNVQSYVIISDSSWQLGRQALERISLSRSKIKFGLKHRAHLGSN